MAKSGVAFHCHHDRLVEFVTNYDERVAYIKQEKPPAERPLRLRLFQMVPPERLSAGLAEAVNESTRLREESDRLRAEGNRLWEEGHRLWAEASRLWTESTRLWAEGTRLWEEGHRLWAESTRLWTESTRLWAESTRLGVENIAQHMPELLALHAELCPECPWNGQTIFGREENPDG